LPTVASSWRTWLLAADWLTPSRLAARVKLSSELTAMKVRRWRWLNSVDMLIKLSDNSIQLNDVISMPFRCESGPMSIFRRLRIDPFLAALVLIPVVATLFPVRDGAAEALDTLTIAAICLLFFLHAAKLAPSQTLAVFRLWPFQLLVLIGTFVLFPAFGLLISLLPTAIISSVIATGFLFLCLLPSTAQSSIAFTSVARGNVALAVSSASVSNVLGVIVTPLLAAALLGSQVEVTPQSILEIIGELVIPFIAGQLLHRH